MRREEVGPLATEALVATAPPAERPYAPSWLNRLITAIDSLPGPTWAAYAVLGLVSVAFSNAQGWVTGLLPVGAVDPVLTYWGVFLVALIWIVAYLDRVAGSAFDAFRPALDMPEAQLASRRYQLVVLPSVPAWLVTIAAFVITPLYYIADPVVAAVVGYTPAQLVLRAASEGFSSAVLLLIILQLGRQLRMVDSIVASAEHIDLFQPGPVYAFSRLTARAAIALIVLIGTSTVVAAPTDLGAASLLLWGPWIVGIPLFGIAAFVLPLRGMHERLVVEKERLQGETESRLKRLLAEINRDVDAGDLSRADALNKALATVLQERDVIAHLPTWPWSTSTLRAIGTAVALPLLLFLAQRVLSQVV
jgi:hypothetical protein